MRTASEPPDPIAASPLRFPRWELRPAERQVLVDGEPVRVGGRAFEVLWQLARQAGRVVSRQDLLERAWPGRVVEENNLTVQITALRKALGHEAIVNVAGVGYRLAAQPLPAGDDPLPPQVNSSVAARALFGRDDDLAALVAHLDAARVLSLVGPGGVGKTCLARALVARPGRHSGQACHWLDLTSASPDAALLPLLARTLGLQAESAAAPSEDLLRVLQGRIALVVLDNCEHLLDAVSSLLAPLLERAPGIQWLATSQEPLQVTGEIIYRVKPLPVPGPNAAIDELHANPALALLRERAAAAGLTPHWSSEQLGQAAELCRRLDGLPLALEIAAARAGTLGLQALNDQIHQRLRLRTGARHAPARHQSLLQTYAWSYGLLSPLEQRVFRSVAGFVDGFDVAMVKELHQETQPDHAMVATEWELLDALDALVSKSLLQGPADDADPRMRLLESARDFARLQLDAHGETARMQDLHAARVLRRFAQAFDDHERWTDAQWRARYAPELGNVRAALDRALQRQDPDMLASLVAALGLLESFLQTPSDLIHIELPMAVLTAAPAAVRAHALCELAWAHGQDGRRDLGTELGLRALQDFEAIGHVAGQYRTLLRLMRMVHGRPGRQRELLAFAEKIRAIDPALVPLRSRLAYESSSSYLVGEGRSVERLRQLEKLTGHAGFDDLADICRVNLTDLLMVEGRHDEVVALATSMLRRPHMHPRRRAQLQHNLALSLTRLGRDDEALDAARASVDAMPSRAHHLLDLRAHSAARHGFWEAAGLLAGHSASIKRQRDLFSETAEAAVIRDTLDLLAGQLGAVHAQELLDAGARMSTDAALELALRRDFGNST